MKFKGTLQVKVPTDFQDPPGFLLGGPFDLVSRVSKVGYWGL